MSEIVNEKRIAPQSEAPQSEAPQSEAPQSETPQSEAPQSEAPQSEAPQSELIPKGFDSLSAGEAQAPGLGVAGTSDLRPINQKDFNEFIKGKGFTGRNNYKLKELKAMFGFKPLTYKNQTAVNIDDGKQFKVYESISKALIGSGIPYITLIQAKKKYKVNPSNPLIIRFGGNIYIIKFNNKL